jgi:branched-chain amino acid transport system substrate-binding protein
MKNYKNFLFILIVIICAFTQAKCMEEIRIGTTLEIIETDKMGKEVLAGLSTKIESINTQGGLNGVPIKFTALNDKYEPELAEENVKKLINEYDTDIVISSIGSSNLKKYLYLVKEGKIAVICPMAATASLRTPDLKYSVFLRATYASEVKALTLYAINKEAKRIVFFTENDPDGRETAKNGIQVLNKRGFEKVEAGEKGDLDKKQYMVATHTREKVDVEQAAENIREFEPDTLIFLTAVKPSTALIRELTPFFFPGKTLLGISDHAESIFKKFIKDSGLNFIISHVMPNPQKSQLDIVKEYRKAMKQADKPITDFTLEGYINASVALYFIDKAMKKYPNEVITKEQVIKAAESTQNESVGGLNLNFDPNTREIAKNIWLNTGEGDWILQSADEEPVESVTQEEKEEVEQAAPEEEEEEEEAIVIY